MSPLPLDHLAYRVRDREAALAAYETLGWSKVADFLIQLEDGSLAASYALAHPHSTEVFISSGPPGSYIDRWVEARGGKGALHHRAYAVEDVAATMVEWKKDGVEFCSEEPIVCPCEDPLVQVFTKEDENGLIIELINRGNHMGFCPENVKRLMDSAPD